MSPIRGEEERSRSRRAGVRASPSDTDIAPIDADTADDGHFAIYERNDAVRSRDGRLRATARPRIAMIRLD